MDVYNLPCFSCFSLASFTPRFRSFCAIGMLRIFDSRNFTIVSRSYCFPHLFGWIWVSTYSQASNKKFLYQFICQLYFFAIVLFLFFFDLFVLDLQLFLCLFQLSKLFLIFAHFFIYETHSFFLLWWNHLLKISHLIILQWNNHIFFVILFGRSFKTFKTFSSYLRGWRRTLHHFMPCIVLICVAYTIRRKSMFNVEIIFIFENFIIFRKCREIFERYKVILIESIRVRYY